jgi:two-component system OmpR family sensor kinase/two-component system sensor histidine kinase QseC
MSLPLPARLGRSLRLRLLASLLSVVVLASVILGALTYRGALREAEALFDYQLEQMALSLRDQGAITLDEAHALSNPRFDFVVQIWSFDGRLIYASRPDAGLPPRAVLGLADIRVNSSSGSTTWRVYSTVSNNGFGDRIIQVAQPLRIRSALAANAALRGMLPLLALTPLLAAAVWWTVASALRPLQRLAADVRQRNAASLDEVSADHLPDEVAPLVQALNGLLARLQRAFEAQRGFVANAAHELRSPLTALKLQAQLIERSPDDAARRAAVAELRAGIDRATHLVEQLLTLARNEPGARTQAPEPVDLAEAVRLAVAETVGAAAAKQIELTLHADQPVIVPGHADALRILARNLVDNSVRYTPAGGQVQVRVDSDDGQAMIVVDDSGPGIAPTERERVFERFYRGTSGGADGSGLGLAIAQGVARQHGAAVELSDSHLGGLRATVRWGLARHASLDVERQTSNTASSIRRHAVKHHLNVNE